MRKFIFIAVVAIPAFLLAGMGLPASVTPYTRLYTQQLNTFGEAQQQVIGYIEKLPGLSPGEILSVKEKIGQLRIKMKALDFWLRYLEPVAYMKINGPLPVEWENEVFEKYEKPYRREGAGLTLAELYLDEENPQKDSLIKLLQQSDMALATFRADSVTVFLQKPDHFFFANRLFLLNLAAIYTTGFECPDSSKVIPELGAMLESVNGIYAAFEQTFPADTLYKSYTSMYAGMQQFVNNQPTTPGLFDHYTFIKNWVNPLFALNQQLIHQYHAVSRNYNDYSLNNNCYSIFDKSLYRGQNAKGIFLAIDDPATLAEIRETGRQLFYDPILSGNGKRSCASCHKPKEFFTDTAVNASLQFDETNRLPRNTPSLLNAVYNHLLMLDGRHITLQNQATDVITNPAEMGSNENDIVNNVLSCNTYKKAFKQFAKLTPNYPEVSLEHITSALTFYYAEFSRFNAPFDNAVNNNGPLSNEAVKGFNLFMGKAQCTTCHFVPVFNGVKPPYVSSEFEVLGVPADVSYKKLSSDSGRYNANPAIETLHAFRTNTVRNSSYTKPYMHNGVFKTMDEVIDFYDTGGGAAHGLEVGNQTLSSDSLHLSAEEKMYLKVFLKTLDEKVVVQDAPSFLPETKLEKYKNRIVGGVY